LEQQLSAEKENIPPVSDRAAEVGNLKSSVLHPSRETHLYSAQPPSAEARDIYPLVGREEECTKLDNFLQQSLSSGPGSGKCLYISGGPGTGKTCSARASIKNWRCRYPDTQVLELNCMDLTQRSVSGVFQRLLEKLGRGRASGKSMAGLAAAAASGLGELGSRVVLVVDEIDQLVSRSHGKAACGALSLETLFSLPRMAGAPALAIIAIANAVDLLERTSAFTPGFGCKSLLFTTYDKDQLKNIVLSRIKSVECGEAALKAIGPVKLGLCVAQAAKERGDCRQVSSFIEEAIFEAKMLSQRVADASTTDSATSSPTNASTTPAKRPMIQTRSSDPLQAVPQLPIEQQMLLFVLSCSKKEAVTLSDLCGRYKKLCRDLRQPANLGSRSQVNAAVTALEQRGLLEMRAARAGKGRGKAQLAAGEASVELSVSCDVLRKEVLEAVPLLRPYV
jgi:Cdc6-like AAA superfamily ATPase